MSENKSDQQVHPMFDWNVWTAGTTIELCQVPWDSDYRDVVSFENETVRDAYFASLTSSALTFQIEHMIYLKYNEPIRVNIPLDACMTCNYVKVSNPSMPVPYPNNLRIVRTYYYFINDCRYVAPNTTELALQLDVWQTYYNSLTFGRCYVERGHIGIANANCTFDNMSDYLIEPEGISVGEEYDVTRQIFRNLMHSRPYLVVMSTASLVGNFGNINAPNLRTATGSMNNGIPNGCNTYLISGADIDVFMEELHNAPWVSQCISYMGLVPHDFIGNETDLQSIQIANNKITAWRIPERRGIRVIAPYSINQQMYGIPVSYQHLKKLYTYPYCGIEISNFSGSAIIVKPQYLNSPFSLTIQQLTAVAPPQVISYAVVLNYNSTASDNSTSRTFSVINAENDTYQMEIGAGDWLDHALVFDNFPQIGLVNNSYMLTMASTVNSRAYQEQAADWSYQKAINAAQLSYDQNAQSIDTSKSNLDLSNRYAWQNNDISNQQAVLGGAEAIASGLASRSLGGLASIGASALNTAASIGWNAQKTSLSTALATNTLNNNNQLSSYIADTNLKYAQYASKGDYAMSIGAIQAAVNDARLIPPSVSGQNTGQVWNFANGVLGFVIKIKRLKTHFMMQVAEYWMRFGYAINRFLVPPQNLKCMNRFTYWKMQQAAVFGTLPEIHKNAIRGILESGVTIWNNPSDINRIVLTENKPLEGIYY